MEIIEHHTPSESADIVIQPLAEEYLQVQNANRNTQRIRRRALSHWQHFLATQGPSRLQDITGADLERWRLQLSQNDLAPGSVELYARSVRQFFSWLANQQRIFLNPAADFLVPKSTRISPTVLSSEQIQRLLLQPAQSTPIGLRDRALLAIAYETGITTAELLRLHCHDASQAALEIRKGKPRSIPLGEPAAQALPGYLTQARPVLLANKTASVLWLNREGKPLLAEALRQVLMRHSAAAGLGYVSPNALRRACIVHRWQSGLHPVQLQLLMGYANLRTLSQYLRVTVTELFQPYQETGHDEKAIA